MDGRIVGVNQTQGPGQRWVEENCVLGRGNGMCLPGSKPDARYHSTETLQRPEKKLLILQIRTVRLEEVM